MGIEFQDVNLDGFTDIVLGTGGTLNEAKDLFIWYASSRNFTKVVFKGFDILSYFEVYDGYIENWVKGSAYAGIIQKLVWNANLLILESEESYKLE